MNYEVDNTLLQSSVLYNVFASYMANLACVGQMYRITKMTHTAQFYAQEPYLFCPNHAINPSFSQALPHFTLLTRPT